MISATYMYNFIAGQFLPNSLPTRCSLGILSASSTGFLLVGSVPAPELYVYTTSGISVTKLIVPNGELACAAVWTPGGNIVCTTDRSVMLLSITGDILSEYNYGAAGRFSVSQDGDIYITITSKNEVYKSNDDGMTWNLMFKAFDRDIDLLQAIKVSSNQYNDIYWILEAQFALGNKTKQLCILTLNKTADNTVWNITRSYYTMCTYMYIDIPGYTLTFDGHSTVFALNDKNRDVLTWSVNGTFNGQLQLLLDNSYQLARHNSLAVDSANHTMYIGLAQHGEVKVNVFTLTYESF